MRYKVKIKNLLNLKRYLKINKTNKMQHKFNKCQDTEKYKN